MAPKRKRGENTKTPLQLAIEAFAASSPPATPSAPAAPSNTAPPNTAPPKPGASSQSEPSSPSSSEFSRRKFTKRNHTRIGFCPKDSDPFIKSRQELPIWEHRTDIKKALRVSDVTLIIGETGSGKSTQVPQFLYEQRWCRGRKVKVPGEKEEVWVGGTVAITQPRRVAATTLAHRVARETGTPLEPGRRDGNVGYSVRFDHNVPRGAKIKFLTEGMLLQELLHDPNLRKYSAVIVDEIHERSLDVDLLVGFLKQILSGDKAGRGGIPLKVIIMSATVDVDVIQDFFRDLSPSKNDDSSPEDKQDAVEVLRIPGRQHPVEIVYEPEPVASISDAIVDKVLKVHTQEQFPGDILAFFIGQTEIEDAQKLIEQHALSLASNVPKVKVVPLYGRLSNEAQREAFSPVKAPFTRKIVLATNIAETSVTVPGVKYVVDCGKAKVKKFRTKIGMESLLAQPISKSSSVQRAGRAGREGPGKCFRLYPEEGYSTLPDADLPEILRVDMASAVLTMKARGIRDVLNFPLMNAPGQEAIDQALLQLHFFRALDDDGDITPAGKTMARFPMPVGLAAVLLAASRPEYDCVVEVVDIVSCLTSGGDIFLQMQSEEQREAMETARKELQRREGDVITMLTTMQRYTSEHVDRAAWCEQRGISIGNMRSALNIRKQLRRMCLDHGLLTEAPPADPQPFVPISPERADTLLKCFLESFGRNTALLQPDQGYKTSESKRPVAIHPSSVLHGKKKEAIMFLEHVFTQKSYAKQVSAVRATWIEDVFEARYLDVE